MESVFIDHIRSKNLLDPKSRYLLALSGGADSVALGYLLKAAGINFEIAHVNYSLRGEESDEDEAFVKDLAKKWGVILHFKKIEERAFSSKEGSTQMVARDIRYSWFDEILALSGLQGVLVAHHFEDQMETILLNLLRGAGIEGVYGMSDRRGPIIRPLLSFYKEELLHYLQENNYRWREDRTNKESYYRRNFLRNEVFPLIEQKFPMAMPVMGKSFRRIKDTGKAFFYLYQQWKERHVHSEGDYQFIRIKDFINLPGKSSFLFYWLRDFGFGTSDIEDVLVCAEHAVVGKFFYSGEYVLNVDREELILGKSAFDWRPISIAKGDIRVQINTSVYDIIRVDKNFPLDRNVENAMLDLDKLSFPLTVRKWEQGDRMVPLGMKSRKKISDVLIDLKLPLLEKRKAAVLLSEGEVVWLVGHRIGEKYKCDVNTENVLYLKKIKP
ncbi:tRNA lysidine(34) synthetase TilS [Cecembia sp.]|uniref:tRNA lysidine(34) synthetase TilS n=1 Tax=Cecembia sp. TaxID=1898110 RepID=UPI0025B95E1D|nr:tRNA lysidine(34) synthetase TilS [Cecembia sp.]